MKTLAVHAAMRPDSEASPIVRLADGSEGQAGIDVGADPAPVWTH